MQQTRFKDATGEEKLGLEAAVVAWKVRKVENVLWMLLLLLL